MYIIQNTSMDFPDAAQRFNWCNCQGPARKKLGVAGLGDTPIFDFSFWSSQLSGGGAPTLTPAGASSAPMSTFPAAVTAAGSMLLPGLVAGGLALWAFSKMGKGGRRR